MHHPAICTSKAIAPEHRNKILNRKFCQGFVAQKELSSHPTAQTELNNVRLFQLVCLSNVTD